MAIGSVHPLSCRGVKILRESRGARSGVLAVLAACVIVLFSASSAFAANTFVSVIGSDTAGDGTYENPYQSIQYAVGQSANGDDVIVGAGVFEENVNMDSSTRFVSLHGAGPELTTIAGVGAVAATVKVTAPSVPVVIDGFTICNGTDGGIYAIGPGTVTVSNNTIRDNTGWGGLFFTNVTGLVTGNLIQGNSALTGGAYLQQGTGVFSDNVVQDNSTSSNGGALKRNGGRWLIQDSHFYRNTAAQAGGAMYFTGCTDTISGCEFVGNSAGAQGGGGVWASNSTLLITQSIFRNNITGSSGGAIYLSSSSNESTVSRSLVESNSAGAGGGIYAGVPCYVRDSVISSNTAVNSIGGGVASGASALTLQNVTVTLNRAPGSLGGGLYSGGSTNIVNSILWGNTASANPQFCGGSFSYSCVEGGAAGTGNISTDPSFIDTSTSDYQLGSSSPCIDVATSSAPASDYAGVWRPQGAAPDMGAYEYHEGWRRPTLPSIESSLPRYTWMRLRDNEITVTGSAPTVADMAGYWIGIWSGTPPDLGPRPDTELMYSGSVIPTSFTFPEGRIWIQARALDVAGHWSDFLDFGPFYVDLTPPTEPKMWSSTHSVGVPSSEPTVSISLTATEPIAYSDVWGFRLEVDTEPTTTLGTPSSNNAYDSDLYPNGNLRRLSNGTWYFHARPSDLALNWGTTAHFGPVVIENNPPRVTIDDPPSWVSNLDLLRLHSPDMCIDHFDIVVTHEGNVVTDGRFSAYAEGAGFGAATGVYDEGTSTVAFSVANDCLVHSATHTVECYVDKSAPVISELAKLAADAGTARVRLSASDAYSGVRDLFWRIDGAATQTIAASETEVLISGAGTHTVSCWAEDNVGLQSDVRNAEVTATVAPQVALTSASKTISYGGTFAVAGRMTSGTAGLVGQQVVLQSSSNGVSFVNCSAPYVTGVNGSFTFTVKPTVKTWYRVRTVATPDYAQVDSSAIYAAPRAAVGTPYAPYTMYRSSYYTVYGAIYPYHSSGTVRIYKYRYVSGRYVSYGYVNAAIRGNKYTVRMRLPYAGRWRLRAYHWDAGHAATWSPGFDYVTVK